MPLKNKIVFNTSVLYVKMIITIGISFYSTRIVLSALGVDDFGIYSVIGGLIGGLSFLSASMASATQRFLSFYIGENKPEKVKIIFSNSVFLHLIIGVIMVIVFELLGNYFINNYLNIDPSKIGIAKTLLHFVVVTSFFTIISVPYDSVIDANENMLFVSIIGILESALKLIAAFFLTTLLKDKLFYYGLLLMVISILIRLIKQVYTSYNYEECKVSVFKNIDKKVIKEILKFASWNIVGIVVFMTRNQGVIIVLSVFFSTAIVAAYGIANQVINQMSFFSETMMKTLRPRIIKSEGEKDRYKMTSLCIQASKFSFFLISFFLIPFFFEINELLSLWLEEIPDFTDIFCRLIIILMILRQLTVGIIIAAHAVNDIKKFQLITSPIQLLSLPIGYVFFQLNYPPYTILIVMVIIEIISIFIRIYYFKISIKYSFKRYFNEVVFKSIYPFIIVFAFLFVFKYYIIQDMSNYLLLKTGLIFLVSMTLYTVFFYKFTLNIKERIIANRYLHNFLKKINL